MANHVRVLNGGLVVSDYRNQSDTSKAVFRIDSSYIDNRMQFQYCGDSCVAYACSLNGSYYEGATVEYSKFGGKPRFENCYIKGLSSRCARVQYTGKVIYKNCTFDGSNLYQNSPVIISNNADSVYIDSSYVNGMASDKSFNNSNTSAYVKSRNSVYDNYNTSFYISGSADLGLLADPGNNCFIDDMGMAINYTYKLSCHAQWNYFDTLLFGGQISQIFKDSVNTYCTVDSSFAKTRTITIYDSENNLPEQCKLGPAIPNPFNSSVEIRYNITGSTDIQLSIYDISGRMLSQLVSEYKDAGAYSAVWDGKNSSGQDMPSGVYIARLSSPKFGDNKIVILIR